MNTWRHFWKKQHKSFTVLSIWFGTQQASKLPQIWSHWFLRSAHHVHSLSKVNKTLSSLPALSQLTCRQFGSKIFHTKCVHENNKVIVNDEYLSFHEHNQCHRIFIVELLLFYDANHNGWMLQVKWLVLTNRSALLEIRVWQIESFGSPCSVCKSSTLRNWSYSENFPNTSYHKSPKELTSFTKWRNFAKSGLTAWSAPHDTNWGRSIAKQRGSNWAVPLNSFYLRLLCIYFYEWKF